MYLYFIYLLFTMKLTSEQQKIIDLINQLPDNLKENTVNIISQMHASTETTKKDLTDAMIPPAINEKGKEMLEKYNATKKIVDEFHQFCLKLSEKEKPNLFDRFGLSVKAISQLALPLLQVWGKENWLENESEHVVENLKTDLVYLYAMRYFLLDYIEGYSLNDFKKNLDVTIPKKIEEYNDKISHDSIAELNTTIDKDLRNKLINLFEKLKNLEKHEEFTNKMWDNFVEDFVKKADKITWPSGSSNYRWEWKELKTTKKYETWFFEHLFNIAYHAADYIDNVKNNKDTMFNFNYNFLNNNFDLDKTSHYEFQHNHIEKSTLYSNLVYERAEELGIEKLKILVGKYLIKP